MAEATAESEGAIPLNDIISLPVTPALGSNTELTDEIFKIIADKSKALVLIGYATGTTPHFS